MLKDLKLGQYIPGNSLTHGLDPRTKIIILLMFTILAFVIQSALGIAILAVILMAVIKLSGLKIRLHLSSIKVIWPVLVITMIINTFTLPGITLLRIAHLTATHEGAYLGIMMVVRICLVIMISSLFSFTTSPMELTGGLERILSPLARFGVPAGELALMMSIALRFIPTIVEEGERLVMAIQARGGDLSTGGIISKLRSLTPLLIPLFLSAFRRADELAVAMEARGYRPGAARTSFRELKLKRADYLILVFCSATFIVTLFVSFRVFGGH